MSPLLDALRRKYATPAAAMRALGLSASLIDGPRLAADENKDDFEQLFRALRAKPKVAAAQRGDFDSRFPDAAKIRTW